MKAIRETAIFHRGLLCVAKIPMLTRIKGRFATNLFGNDRETTENRRCLSRELADMTPEEADLYLGRATSFAIVSLRRSASASVVQVRSNVLLRAPPPIENWAANTPPVRSKRRHEWRKSRETGDARRRRRDCDALSASRGGVAGPETLAQLSGCSTRAVRYHVSELERAGIFILRRERRPDGGERIYYRPGSVMLRELAAFRADYPKDKPKVLRVRHYAHLWCGFPRRSQTLEANRTRVEVREPEPGP